MKYIALLVGLSLVSFAVAREPTIIGYVPNRANSKITFTTDRGSCQDGQHLAYTQNDGGRIGFVGCYRLIDGELFVVWSDGDVYTYDFSAMVFSEEFKNYIQKGE